MLELFEGEASKDTFFLFVLTLPEIALFAIITFVEYKYIISPRHYAECKHSHLKTIKSFPVNFPSLKCNYRDGVVCSSTKTLMYAGN